MCGVKSHGVTFDVSKSISNIILNFIKDMITYHGGINADPCK